MSGVFFLIEGHPFGLTASVFHTCRRRVGLTNILLRIFGIVIFGYGDDRFGLAQLSLVKDEAEMVCLG